MLRKPSNRSREEIQRLAADAIRDNGGPSLARVFYKFDCGACGSREVCPEPNVLPLEGRCTVCGSVTNITGAGFALNVRRSETVDWGGVTLVLRKPYESDRGDA